MEFQNVGTKRIGIGQCAKVGTMSLLGISELSHQQQPRKKLVHHFREVIHDGEFKTNKKYVILLRDVFDKWKSGMWMESQSKEGLFYRSNVFEFFNKNIFKNGFRKNTSATKTALQVMSLLHNPRSPYGTEWMFRGHGMFWKWNNFNEIPINIYAHLPNIYFLDLKDLSNPKFLDWLCEQDSDWKSVTEIPHRNKSGHKDIFWKQMKLFWTEYDGGLILGDKVLVSPLSTRNKFDVIDSMFNQEQMTIDFIRKHHNRYLKFN